MSAISAMPKKSIVAAGMLLIFAAGLGVALWLGEGERPLTGNRSGQNALASWLKEVEQFFPRELNAKTLIFPGDHGAHAEAPLEAWEFYGIVTAKDGRSFAFQWSLFRLGLRPHEPQRRSTWASREIYRGIFTVSDVADHRFHAFERFSRAALHLAGSQASPPRIWLENWTMTVSQSPDGTPVFHLGAASEGVGLELRLESVKPPVLPGSDGLLGSGGSRLSGYLFSRLRADGSLQVNKVTHAAQGAAWLGRIWGRSLPPGGQTVLNRYQIQLDDGREIVAFQLRRRDGSAEPIDSGYWIEKDGRTRAIRRGDLKIEPTGHWASGKTGVRYPVRWKILLFPERLELDLSPLLEDQEIRSSQRSWSGAVSVTAKIDGRDLASGSGFVHLTGY